MLRGSPPAAVLFMLILAALACSVEYSTAHFENPTLYKDPAGDERTRTYTPDETFYCITELVDADVGSQVRAVWVALPGEDSETDTQTDVAETTLETGNGPLTFEAAPPESGWATGPYRLDLYLDGETKTSVTFSVK